MKRTSLISFLILATAAFSVDAFELPLTVDNATDIARKGTPARGGIPLEAGKFKKDQAFAVFAGDKEIPSQIVPIVVDKDDCIRWLLVDFLSDYQPNEKKTFTLKAAVPAAKLAVALKIAETDDGVTVDSGKMKFTISKKKPFTLFSDAEVAGKKVLTGGEISYVSFTNPKNPEKRCVAGAPEEITVERSGPLRVTIKVQGPFEGDDKTAMQYIARITAWAGRSDVFVKYSLVNSNEDQYVYRRIKDSTIKMKLATAASGSIIGADKPIEAGTGGWLEQGLLPYFYYYYSAVAVPNSSHAGDGDKQLWVNKGSKSMKGQIEGWLAAKAAGGSVFVCDRFMRENPPRRMALKDGHLVLKGTIKSPPPQEIKRGKRIRKVGKPFQSEYRWLLDCGHLSSEYVIDFAAPADAAKLTAMGKAARLRLHVMAPPAWYSETECIEFGKFGTQEDEVKCYDAWGWKYNKKKMPTGPRLFNNVNPPWLNYPRFTQGTHNHYDSEGDVLETLVLMYLRSGGRKFHDHAMAWANHGMDLRIHRTDGFEWSDGGVWWTKGGPAGGNRPSRETDPISGFKNYLVGPSAKKLKTKQLELGYGDAKDMSWLPDSRQCNCHNYAAGMVAWYLITGDLDALEAAVDSVEMTYNFSAGVRGRNPGEAGGFSREFTRGFRGANALRFAMPTDDFAIEASDHFGECFLQRERKEPRGFANPPRTLQEFQKKVKDKKAYYEKLVGKAGMAAMEKAEIKIDPASGQLIDLRNRWQWIPVINPHTFMYAPLYRAVESYYKLTGNEDAQDWVIAHGKAFAQIAYQTNGNFVSYSRLAVDFPNRGVCKDPVSWQIGPTNKYAEGIKMSGYTARHWPDAPARAYSLCGEPFLKKRGYDYWWGGSHRGYAAVKMHRLGEVGRWVNYTRPQEGEAGYCIRMFYEHAHPRKDAVPPKAVTDLTAKMDGDTATVSFTVPADEGGGKVTRYQVKCSPRPIVDYEKFLDVFNKHGDKKVTNWWMAWNLKGEPKPVASGKKVTFTLEEVDEEAKYFAVRTFDESSNRSPISNIAKVK